MTWKRGESGKAREKVWMGRGEGGRRMVRKEIFIPNGECKAPTPASSLNTKNLSPDIRTPDQCLIFIAPKTALDGKREKGREFSGPACAILKSIRF